MNIKAGATAWHRIKPGVDLALIREIIITYRSKSPYGAKIIFQRRYPAETELYEGDILVPLTQADTAKLREESGESVSVELQYNYISGAVDKSQIKTVAVKNTLATEYVDGSAPDAAQRDAVPIEFESDAVIVMGVDKDQGKENAGKLLYVGADGNVALLQLGTGLEIVNGRLCIIGTVTPDEPDEPAEAITFTQTNENTVAVSGVVFEQQADGTVLWRGATFNPGDGNTVIIF